MAAPTLTHKNRRTAGSAVFRVVRREAVARKCVLSAVLPETI
jgi:hypothetical protein